MMTQSNCFLRLGMNDYPLSAFLGPVVTDIENILDIIPMPSRCPLRWIVSNKGNPTGMNSEVLNKDNNKLQIEKDGDLLLFDVHRLCQLGNDVMAEVKGRVDGLYSTGDTRLDEWSITSVFEDIGFPYRNCFTLHLIHSNNLSHPQVYSITENMSTLNIAPSI